MDLGGQISRLERHLFGVPERKRGLSVGEILAPKRGPAADKSLFQMMDLGMRPVWRNFRDFGDDANFRPDPTFTHASPG